MESLKTLCLLVLFLAIVSTPGSTGLHLGVSFDQLNELVNDKMHLKCSGDGTMHGPRTTLMMKIGKVGDPKPLAVFNLGKGITMRPVNASKTITAVGHLDKVRNQVFLNVTIDRPDEKDAGTYKCQLLYMDQQHQIQQEKELLKVVIEAPDTPTLVKYFVKKLEYLKDTISELNDTVKVQKEMISELKDTTKANTKSTKSHDRVLAELNITDTIRHQLQDFKTKATYQYAFMARFKFGDKFSKSKVLRFRDIVMNNGGAYSPGTGVFKAPVDGVYVFHLTIRTRFADNWIVVHLRVNQKWASKVRAAGVKEKDQSSTQAVVPLQAGDKVNVWVLAHKDRTGIAPWGYTVFSGFLLQAS